MTQAEFNRQFKQVSIRIMWAKMRLQELESEFNTMLDETRKGNLSIRQAVMLMLETDTISKIEEVNDDFLSAVRKRRAGGNYRKGEKNLKPIK